MIRAVVLAAGAGSRLGGAAKALLKKDGETFIGRIGRICAATGVSDPIVVLGPPHEQAIAPLAIAAGFSVAANRDPSRGMASSISIGFAALGGRGDCALLWPVDTALVGAHTVSQLIAIADAKRLVKPTLGGRGGHPVAVGRALFEVFAQCDREKEGARTIFRHNQECVLRVAVDDPMVLCDFDTPDDLALHSVSR